MAGEQSKKAKGAEPFTVICSVGPEPTPVQIEPDHFESPPPHPARTSTATTKLYGSCCQQRSRSISPMRVVLHHGSYIGGDRCKCAAPRSSASLGIIDSASFKLSVTSPPAPSRHAVCPGAQSLGMDGRWHCCSTSRLSAAVRALSAVQHGHGI